MIYLADIMAFALSPKLDSVNATMKYARMKINEKRVNLPSQMRPTSGLEHQLAAQRQGLRLNWKVVSFGCHILI